MAARSAPRRPKLAIESRRELVGARESTAATAPRHTLSWRWERKNMPTSMSVILTSTGTQRRPNSILYLKDRTSGADSCRLIAAAGMGRGELTIAACALGSSDPTPRRSWPPSGDFFTSDSVKKQPVRL
jgi:hypothetical protein